MAQNIIRKAFKYSIPTVNKMINTYSGPSHYCNIKLAKDIYVIHSHHSHSSITIK